MSRSVTVLLALIVLVAATVVIVLANTGAGHRPRELIAAAPNHLVSAVNGFTLQRLPAAQRNVQLDAIRSAGVTVVRADAPWAEIEPDPPGPTGPAWHFAATDAWVAALATHHLAWEPVIDYSVSWAKRCPGFCAPAVNATYARFAGAVASRYGARGSFWRRHPALPYRPARTFEIWNEENTHEFWVAPARYGALYASARAAIHATDPRATVMIGGLADDSQTFDRDRDYPAQYVDGMFAADPRLRGRVDAFGLHPYGATAADAQDWVADFRATLDRLGETRTPIEITELGWPTGNASREAWRATAMAALARSLSRVDCGIGLVAPYDWIDPGAPSGGDFGLVGPSGAIAALRPAGTAWFRGLAGAASAIGSVRCSL